MEYKHKSVLLKEAVDFLQPKRGGYFIDGTLGGGGYTALLSAAAGEEGRILAIDLDRTAIENTAKKNLKNVILVQGNFKDLAIFAKQELGEEAMFDGIVFDLGLSSAQLDDLARGFSFRFDAPLDMSFEGRAPENSTEKIVNKYSEARLKEIFSVYGEERFSGQIAREIIKSRRLKPLKTTAELAEIVKSAVPKKFWGNIHPATKVFQALRIETNKEIESLKEALPAALGLLKPGGRLAIVSFHSLEDRIVKDFFKH